MLSINVIKFSVKILYEVHFSQKMMLCLVNALIILSLYKLAD